MYFLKYLFKSNLLLANYLGSPEGFTMDIKPKKKDSSDNYDLNKMVDLQKINVDGKLTKKEIAEVKKVKEYSSEKLKTLFDTKSKFKEFINAEYRYANENYLSSKGKTIKDLQKKLNKELGLNLVTDNVFGKQTFLAIIRFQKENNLTVDRLVGDKTFKELFNEEEQQKEREGPEKDDGEYKGSTMLANNNEKNTNFVIKRAIEAVENGDRLGASNCTDFVSKIWGKDVNNGRYVFKGDICRGSEGTGLIPKKYAPNNIISTIQPGNHILVDKPPYGVGRTHSIMAIAPPNNGLVKVASFPGNAKEYWDLYGLGRGNKDAHVARIHRLS